MIEMKAFDSKRKLKLKSSFKYDSQGNQIEERKYKPNGILLETIKYDSNGNLTEIK